MTRISSQITSSWRRNYAFVTKYASKKSKNYNLDFMQLCLFSIANTFIVFAFERRLAKYGHVAVNLNFFNRNSTPFYPIGMQFSL